MNSVPTTGLSVELLLSGYDFPPEIQPIHSKLPNPWIQLECKSGGLIDARPVFEVERCERMKEKSTWLLEIQIPNIKSTEPFLLPHMEKPLFTSQADSDECTLCCFNMNLLDATFTLESNIKLEIFIASNEVEGAPGFQLDYPMVTNLTLLERSELPYMTPILYHEEIKMPLKPLMVDVDRLTFPDSRRSIRRTVISEQPDFPSGKRLPRNIMIYFSGYFSPSRARRGERAY